MTLMCVMYNNIIFFNFLFVSAFFKLSKFNVIKGKYIRVNQYVYKKTFYQIGKMSTFFNKWLQLLFLIRV